MIELAFGRMLARAHQLGDRVADRPDAVSANSVSGLITHCMGVTRWWLAHEVLGEPFDRDRDAEFESQATVADLERSVSEVLAEVPGWLERIAVADAAASAQPDDEDPPWSWTPAGMTLHVIEELFQHAGHVDITTDVLLSRR